MPGILDYGGTKEIEINELDEALDPATKEQLANKILGDEYNPETVGGDVVKNMERKYNMKVYDDILSLAVNNYIQSQNPENSGNDVDPSYTSNLYNTVSTYLRNGEKEPGYVSYSVELASKGYTPEREVVEERTDTAKVFRNDDGTYTAVLNDGVVHYRDENGIYQDIDLTIVPSLDDHYGYKSVKNTIKSYFESDASGVKVDSDSGNELVWTPVEMRYIDRFMLDHNIDGASESTGEVNGNVMRYENTFPYTTEEFIVNSGYLKHNLILDEFPESAGQGVYLSYVGKLEMAEGLNIYVNGIPVTEDIETKGAVEIRDAEGKSVYLLPAPFAFEYDNLDNRVDGTYTISFEDGEIYLAMNTPVSWLTDPARVYPVVVDPNIYVTINIEDSGFVYHYYYESGTYVSEYYYNYYPYQYLYVGFQGYDYGSYKYEYTYRSWGKWNTSVIPDGYTIKQIDFRGRNLYNSYSSFGVNVREAPKDPTKYSSSSSTAQIKELYDSLVSGRIYNSSATWPTGYYVDVNVNALGGTAKQDMQDNLTKDRFFLAFHKTIESFLSTGYAYIYLSSSSYAQLYVTYDPCPTAPLVETGGPYRIPEGTNGATLDASETFVCGTSVLYSWDTNEDGLYDIVSTQPKVFWNKNFPDDWSTNITLQVKDLTYNYVAKKTTTFTVYNVNPQIVTPSTTIVGYEGQTLTIPKIEFTDPGTDTHTYYYDFDGDNIWDKTGSTIESGGKLYVPSVSWYFCDDAKTVNMTVEDEDGGYSDSIEQDVVDADYDGDINTYKRDANPSLGGTYKYLTQYDSSYPYVYIEHYTYVDSYDYDYRGIFKFDASSLPKGFTPTNVTMRTYIYYAYYTGQLGINDLSNDPDTASAQTLFNDAGDSNILENGEAINIDDSMDNTYISLYLDPQNFVDETKSHSSWYGVGIDVFSKEEDYFYMYFFGGSYTTLTVKNETKSYSLKCYTDSSTNRNGMYGYVYDYGIYARDVMWREDTYSYMYIRDGYVDYYGGLYTSKSFIKFGEPHVNQSKIVGADLMVYLMYMYGSSGLKIGVNDLDYDPETASDMTLWNDIDSENIYDDSYWEPEMTSTWYLIPLVDKDYMDKSAAHSGWYGVGMKKIGGNLQYMYMGTSEYSYYKPTLLVDHRVPYQLAIDVKNIDPVMDTTDMEISPTTVKEGDEVSVTGITYTDAGPCDEHYYRVIVDLGPSVEPMVAKDWTEASDGKLDFKFKAPDDDPDDMDADISKDDIKVTIELKDDDYVSDFHYKAITLSLTHYEYYMYSWYKDWGVYQNLRPWTENTETWKSYPRSYSKSTPEDTVKAHGDHSYTYPYSYHQDTWDITTLVKKWIAGTEKNYGLRVQPVTAGKDPNLMFAGDYSSSNYRPAIVFEPVEALAEPFELKPGPEGKDVLIRDSPYDNYNHETSYYSYLLYTYDYASSSYPESNGLIEFDLSDAPPETDESGLDSVTFDMTISNVAPVLDESNYRIVNADGDEVDTVLEGEEFVISNITFTDPAAGLSTELFEYRIDMGNGTWSAWTPATVISSGDYVVVPNAYEKTNGGSYNTIPWGPAYGTRRFMQWYDGEQFDGSAGAIAKIGFRYPDVYGPFKITYNNLKLYLSHTSRTSLSSTFADNYGTGRTLVLSKSTFTWEKKTTDNSFSMIELDTEFIYDGTSNVVLEVVYTGGTSTYNYFDCASDPSVMRLWASSPTATTGSYSTGYGLVTKFEYRAPPSPYGVIPPITHTYPDDHPSTGTASDEMQIRIQLRDDDAGMSTGALRITVENVPPTIKPGKVLVNGVEPAPDVLIVKDDTASSYYLEYAYLEAIDALGKDADVIMSTDTAKFTASNMAKYKMVIYLLDYYIFYRYYTSYSDYFSDKEADVLLDYLENYSGKLWFVNNFMYSYSYGSPTPPPSPSYYSWFFQLFGVSQPWTYNYFYPSMVMNGTGSWFDESDEFDIIYPPPVSFSYSTYVSTFTVSGGTPETYYQGYTAAERGYMMVHKEDSSWGSKALISGFDLNQLGTTDEREEIMKAAMDYFGIPDSSVVEIDEGDMIELQDWDIIDPAEGESTETLHFEIDWGDGETGPYTNATSFDGINMLPSTAGDSIIHPNAATTPQLGSGNTIPWGPGFGVRRYMQYYGSKEFGGKKGNIEGIGFRYYQTSTWSITYQNLKIYLSHKSTTGLSSTFSNNYGADRTLVLSKSSYTWTKSVVGQPFTMIMFDNTFKYNGKDNIVMEVSYTSGTPNSVYYFNTYSTPELARLYAYSATSTTGSVGTNYGLVTLFQFQKSLPPTSPLPWESYMHRYRDDPATGDTYMGTVHVYDDDLGHGTAPLTIKVNNIKPTIDPQYVMPDIVGYESGSPSVLLPSISFDDPATQYDLNDPNEKWIYWWDLDNNGMMNNAPDVIGTIPQSYITESGNHSFGKTPQVQAVVNDDYLRKPIACYILDDDMAMDMSSQPDGTTGTITILNVAPVASIEAYVPMEVRVRMTGTQENDLRVQVVQTNPQNSWDVLVDEMTIERMPGQPKENPFADGTPSAPLFVKVQLGRDIALRVTYDATPDSNDIHTDSGPNGADPVWVYLDFPMEDDYDPAEDSQSSSQGHHWAKEIKFNVNQDGSIATDTTDISSQLKDKKGYLIGISTDDASDDAQFNWMVLSGSAPLPYQRITYYNDGSPAQVNGAFKDTYPSPWDGTAPVTYMDMHAFTYGTGFSVALYTIDDDGGKSNTAILTV